MDVNQGKVLYFFADVVQMFSTEEFEQGQVWIQTSNIRSDTGIELKRMNDKITRAYSRIVGLNYRIIEGQEFTYLFMLCHRCWFCFESTPRCHFGTTF